MFSLRRADARKECIIDQRPRRATTDVLSWMFSYRANGPSK